MSQPGAGLHPTGANPIWSGPGKSTGDLPKVSLTHAVASAEEQYPLSLVETKTNWTVRNDVRFWCV